MAGGLPKLEVGCFVIDYTVSLATAWSAIPVCEAMVCPEITVDHGTSIGVTRSGQTALIQCDEGYDMPDSQSGVSRLGDTLTCIVVEPVTQATAWDAEIASTCTIVDCGQYVVTSGEVSGETYWNGAGITVVCISGFRLAANAAATLH